METHLEQLISAALSRRIDLLTDPAHRTACRLFNGFTEGRQDLVIDLLGRTAVIHDYAADCRDFQAMAALLAEKLPFLTSAVLKRRNSTNINERNGILLRGVKTDTFIEEHGVRYAVDITLNHDNSFYADTRLLRKYLLENMKGKSVLNTFAYTGSLGVAAAAGGAEKVLQTDISGKFLTAAYRSASLNGFAFTRKNFRLGDFFTVTAALRKGGEKFDCVILDPPFFSSSGRGVIDLANNPLGVIAKVRPLVSDHGVLIVVNNSLYLSGQAFMAALESICDGKYLTLESQIPIPEDFCFAAGESRAYYPTDPHPFNHPTKIVVLRVRCR